MNITIVAVGKLKERFWVQAADEYLKRLSGYAKVSVVQVLDVDPDKAGGVEAALAKEARSILDAMPRHTYRVLLAIDGTARSSVQFAHHLETMTIQGISDLTFIIGGSDGVAPTIRDHADETLSFGPITLPHNLARIVLLEQLYRAFRIIRHEPYHK